MNAAQSKGSAFSSSRSCWNRTGAPFFLRYNHQNKDIASSSEAPPAKGVNTNWLVNMRKQNLETSPEWQIPLTKLQLLKEMCNSALLWSTGSCPVPCWMWITRKTCVNPGYSLSSWTENEVTFLSFHCWPGAGQVAWDASCVVCHNICSFPPKGHCPLDGTGRTLIPQECWYHIWLKQGEYNSSFLDLPGFGCFGNIWDGFGRGPARRVYLL